MNDSLVEQPKEIILSQINRQSIRISKPNKYRQNLTEGRCHLPPIHPQSQSRRIRTEPKDSCSSDFSNPPLQSRELTKLKRVFDLSGSTVLTTLSKKIESLQSLSLVSGGAVRRIKYSGHIKIPTVHNDYHSSKTNAGYSRNKYGGIYPK